MKHSAAPTTEYLEYAFNRTRLSSHGFTFESAMQSPAIKLSLTRVAQALARPAKPSHMRGAQND